jgi:succinoglycan biosynthesis transport protein ExoP
VTRASGVAGAVIPIATPDKSELDLHAFLGLVRRRLWIVLLVPILATGAAVVSAKAQAPKYRSSADILLVRTQAESLFAPAGASVGDPNRLLADQIRLVRSLPVTELVKARLGFVPPITATSSSTEDVITLSAVDGAAGRAAATVGAYADAYLRYRRTSGNAQNAAAQLELSRQIDAAQAQLAVLDQAVAGQPAAQRPDALASQAGRRLPLESQLSTQRLQLSQLQAAAAVEQGGAQLLAPATVPAVPFAPNPLRTGILGLGVGLMLGLGLAFLLDYLDNRIRGKEALERATSQLPVIGMIPTVADWRNVELAMLICRDEPGSSAAEAYRTLRTSIQFLGLDRSVRTLQVTSPATSDGRTTTLVNLAVALAKAGQRVVVVDCDLRHPRVHEFFGFPPNPGFTSVLLGEVALDQAWRAPPGLPLLRVLSAGPVPPNPSELLSGQRTAKVLQLLQEDADFVLVDSPPVLPVSDAAVIATVVDATLLVIHDNKTLRKHLARALELLAGVNAAVIGTVLNRVVAGDDAYGDRYGYRPAATASSSGGGRDLLAPNGKTGSSTHSEVDPVSELD